MLADVIWKRERQQDILDRIKDPDIIGFSTYVWNHNWNLTLAKKIKQRWPDCLIVFGGPSINESPINKYPVLVNPLSTISTTDTDSYTVPT
jgi:hypothetical protein